MPNDRGGWVWLNSQGRQEGRGTTSRARQARRLAAQEKERWEAGEPTAYQLRQEQAKQEAEQTRAQRRVLSSPPPGIGAREHQRATAQDSSWMPAGKFGKRQPAEEPLTKGTKKALKKNKQSKAAATSSALSLEKGNKAPNPLEKGDDHMETSSEETIVEEVPEEKPEEAKLAELKKKLMEAPLAKRVYKPLKKGIAAEEPSQDSQKGTPASQPKESLQPLEKGIPAEGTSSSSKPLAKGKKLLCKKVAIDWRGTMANNDNFVRPSTLVAIEKLLAAGCEVYILSYCFDKRQAEVKGHAEALPIWDKLSGCLFTKKKIGPHGKAILCKKVGIEALFDNADIMMECWDESVWPFPIKTFHSHSPLEKGSFNFVEAKDTLEEAIDLFLSPDCKFHDWKELWEKLCTWPLTKGLHPVVSKCHPNAFVKEL